MLRRASVFSVKFTVIFLIIVALINQFVEGFNWQFVDFVVSGALVWSGASLCFLSIKKKSYMTALLVISMVSLIWIELAVGVFSS